MSIDTLSSYHGVGVFQLLGLRLTHSEQNHVVAQLEAGPQHSNRAGTVHGGVLCTMIDLAACAAGLHADPGEPQRFGVTLSLTTNFTKGVSKGMLTVEGKVITAGSRRILPRPMCATNRVTSLPMASAHFNGDGEVHPTCQVASPDVSLAYSLSLVSIPLVS